MNNHESNGSGGHSSASDEDLKGPLLQGSTLETTVDQFIDEVWSFCVGGTKNGYIRGLVTEGFVTETEKDRFPNFLLDLAGEIESAGEEGTRSPILLKGGRMVSKTSLVWEAGIFGWKTDGMVSGNPWSWALEADEVLDSSWPVPVCRPCSPFASGKKLFSFKVAPLYEELEDLVLGFTGEPVTGFDRPILENCLVDECQGIALDTEGTKLVLREDIWLGFE